LILLKRGDKGMILETLGKDSIEDDKLRIIKKFAYNAHHPPKIKDEICRNHENDAVIINESEKRWYK
jgi:hypothetical protein